jgi:hypothetical protein
LHENRLTMLDAICIPGLNAGSFSGHAGCF